MTEKDISKMNITNMAKDCLSNFRQGKDYPYIKSLVGELEANGIDFKIVGNRLVKR